MALQTWLATSLVRHFPHTAPKRRKHLTIEGARNERLSFQVGLRQGGKEPVSVKVSAEGPRGWEVRVRRVSYVPVRHFNTPVGENPLDVDGLGCIPGYVPDPLLEEHSLVLPTGETHSFWISLKPPPGARAGRYTIPIAVEGEGAQAQTLKAEVRLYPVTLKRRKNFPITHWFYADAVMDWYKTEGFDSRFWELAERYLENNTAHGLDTLYVPVFTPPLDGVKRPTQLLRVKSRSQGHYSFDWRDVKRYIDLARKLGIRRFEWCHLISQWGALHAIRVYEDQGKDEKLLWKPDTPAVSTTYRNFLSQFLPSLRRFLTKEGLLEKSYFHVSDEPHGEEHLENYRKARTMLWELAPWMQVMDALTDIQFGREQLTDTPIPSIKTALEFQKEDIPSWCYYCCNPRGKYLNRLLDTPLPKIAMHGFLFYRWPFRGFLHWGYNYWYRSQTRELIDPFTIQDGEAWPGWAFGDTFLVYPGKEGPIDSIRWEIFAESLQDYALLQTIGLDRDHPLLRSIRSFEDFPKTEGWRQKVRRQLLANKI